MIPGNNELNGVTLKDFVQRILAHINQRKLTFDIFNNARTRIQTKQSRELKK